MIIIWVGHLIVNFDSQGELIQVSRCIIDKVDFGHFLKIRRKRFRTKNHNFNNFKIE